MGTPRILHRYRRSGAGGSGSSHRYAHACTCPCAPRCAHAHTHRAKPPTHPQAPRTPQPIPVPWGASTAPRSKWKRVAGSHQRGVGPAGPCSPSVMQGRGVRPRTGHPMARRENRSCAQQGLMGCWGMQGSRGAVGARGQPGVWGQGTVTELGEEQHAGGGRVTPREHVPCGKGCASVGKNWHSSPKRRAWNPSHGLGGSPGGLPPPARIGGAGCPSCRHLVPC